MDNLGEELRILYVAMTRAKEKMIMTGVVNDYEKHMLSYSYLKDREQVKLPYGILSRSNHYLDFVLPTTIRNEGVIKTILWNPWEARLQKDTQEVAMQMERMQLESRLAAENSELERENINKLKLDMKLVSAMYTLDKSKILYCYVSEDRVDFRELLKELSTNLKCRIELKQIGARDRSKNVGGIGICGLPLCCASFLNEFEGISINMAKNQYLALNTQKLSGQCNKLLCCLKYEDSEYSKLKEGVPKIGLKFNYQGKHCKVSSINLLSQ